MKSHHLTYFENGLCTGQSFRSGKVYGTVKGKTDSHQRHLGDRVKGHKTGLKHSRSSSPFIPEHRNCHMFREELEVISPHRNAPSPILSSTRILNAVKAPNQALQVRSMTAATSRTILIHITACTYVGSCIQKAVRSILIDTNVHFSEPTKTPPNDTELYISTCRGPVSLWREIICTLDRVTDDITYHDLVVLEQEAKIYAWVYTVIGYVCLLQGYHSTDPDITNRHIFPELRRFLEFLRQVSLVESCLAVA